MAFFDCGKGLSAGVELLRRDWALFKSARALWVFAFLVGILLPDIFVFVHSLITPRPLMILLTGGIILVGLVAGIFLSQRISDQKIELGLVPLGAFSLCAMTVVLGVSDAEILPAWGAVFLMSLSGGLYVAPLSAFLRYRAEGSARFRLGLTVSLAGGIALFAGLGAFAGLLFGFQISPRSIFVLMGAVIAVLTVASIFFFPYPFIRFCVWIMTHTFYRLRVINKEVIPHAGGALIVANHLSFIDVFFIIVSTSRRVRFVTDRRIYNHPLLRPLCRTAGAFPISRKDSVKQIAQTLGSIRRAIQEGDVVCMFPEGGLSRTGNTLRFNRGVEHIMQGLSEPIIPAYLDRVWGSMWSFAGGRYFLKVPRVIPHPVTVVFGEPLSSAAKVFDIRQKVIELGAGAFHYRLEQQMTLPEMFFREMRGDPLGPCVADSTGKRLNRLQTFVASYALAKKLRALFPGEKFVGIFLPPSVGGAVSNVALSIAGKVAVNLNYTASREALAMSVKECGMRHCITSRVVLEKLQIACPAEAVFIEDLVKTISGKDRIMALLGASLFPAALAHRVIFGSWKNLDNSELATVVFTSGSTGIPKGVMLTHANIACELEGLCQIFHITPGDSIMGVLPFFHSFGYTATLWFPLIGGMGAAYHVNPLDAQVVGQMVRENRSTLMIATPTFLSSYTRRCDKKDLSSLRYVVVGAEKLKASIASAFEEKFGIAPLEGYGCTELSPAVSVNLPDYRCQDILQKAQKRGTIGLPLPGIAIKIVHPETSEPLGPRQEGMLLVKGANVMKGYLNQPDLTRAVISDGWYRTGDIAFMDEDGFITITDRLSRFSKIAGEMVPHMRLEEAIHSALGVAEQVCVVASVPDDNRGERLVVLHTIDLDADEFLDDLKKEGLPNLWMPERSMFFKIPALPVLGSGKIDLGAVKRLALELAQHG